MIVTVTPNPSLDRTVHVPHWRPGAVLRTDGPAVLDPSGKGVNVARVLQAAGAPARAVFPCGGPDGALLSDLLRAERISFRSVPIAAAVRSNISVVEPSGTVTKLNEPGPRLSDTEREALIGATCTAAADAEWVVLCGSLPQGVGADLYADLIARLRSTGVRIALDSSGPALRAGASAQPDLVKPNEHELADLIGRPIRTLGEAAQAATEVQRGGIGTVLVSLGAAGALLVDDGGTRWVTSRVEQVRSAVGAGDALLGGFLAGGAAGLAALTTATAWAAATCRLPGSGIPSAAAAGAEAVTVHDRLDPALRLGEHHTD